MTFSITEIFSILLNVGLFVWGVFQLIDARKEQEKSINRMRIWHKHIEGIKNALLQIGQNPNTFTDKADIASAIRAVAQSAVAMDDAFAVERFYKEIEMKEKREADAKATQALFKRLRKTQV